MMVRGRPVRVERSRDTRTRNTSLDFARDERVADTGLGFFSALIGTRKPSPVSSTGRRVRLMDSRLRGNDGIIYVLEPYFFGALNSFISSASSFSTLSAKVVIPAKMTMS